MHLYQVIANFAARWGGWIAWATLALGLARFLHHNDDWRIHRKALRTATLLMAAAPLLGWAVVKYAHSLPLGFLVGLFTGFVALRWYCRILDRAINDVLGGLLFDLVFSEGPFSAAYRAPKKLPNVTLLRHWRDHGRIGPAYRAARRHLVAEERAFPLWLFAAETAALHRDDLSCAIRLVKKLHRCAAFSSDQRTFALQNLKGWAAVKGCELDISQFKDCHQRPPRPKPLAQIIQLREQGEFEKAKAKLHEMLYADPENLAATALLVRIYAQDLHCRAKAEALIRQLDQQRFAPAALVEYLTRSLDDWEKAAAGAPETSASQFEAGSPTSPPARQLQLATPPICTDAAVQPEATADQPPTDIEELLQQGRFGTAVEILESRLKKQADDFTLLLQLATVHGQHCGTLKPAERVVARIEANEKFSPEQKRLAQARLKSWREEHAVKTFLRD